MPKYYVEVIEMIEDLSGRVFGKLTVSHMSQKRKAGGGIAVCDCSCGRKNVEVNSGNLKKGCTKSCGCLSESVRVKNFPIHRNGFLAKRQPGSINKKCSCGESFILEYGSHKDRNKEQAESRKLCDKCLLKKNLGTRVSKDDW